MEPLAPKKDESVLQAMLAQLTEMNGHAAQTRELQQKDLEATTLLANRILKLEKTLSKEAGETQKRQNMKRLRDKEAGKTRRSKEKSEQDSIFAAGIFDMPLGIIGALGGALTGFGLLMVGLVLRFNQLNADVQSGMREVYDGIQGFLAAINLGKFVSLLGNITKLVATVPAALVASIGAAISTALKIDFRTMLRWMRMRINRTVRPIREFIQGIGTSISKFFSDIGRSVMTRLRSFSPTRVIMDAFSGIGRVFGKISEAGRAFTGAFSGISRIFGNISGAGNTASRVLKGIFSVFKGLLTPLGTMLGLASRLAWPLTLAVGLFDGIGAAWRSWESGVRDPIELLRAGIVGVIEGFTSIIGDLGTVFGWAATGILRMIGVPEGFAESIGDGIKGFFDALEGLIRAPLIFLADATAWLIRAPIVLLQGMWRAFTNTLSWLGDGAKMLIDGVFNGFSAIFTAVRQMLAGNFSGAASTIGSQIWDNISGFFGWLVDGVTGFFGPLLGAVGDLFNVSDAISDLKQRALDALTDLFDSVAEGLRNLVTDPIGFMNNIFGRSNEDDNRPTTERGGRWWNPFGRNEESQMQPPVGTQTAASGLALRETTERTETVRQQAQTNAMSSVLATTTNTNVINNNSETRSANIFGRTRPTFDGDVGRAAPTSL